MEAPTEVPHEFLNDQSRYVKSLKDAGFSMREVKGESSPFNGIIYKKESSSEQDGHGEKSNLVMLYAVQGESGGTTHISASFLSELEGKVDTVMGVNSSLSKTALRKSKYNHNLNQQADQMAELYKNSIPEEEKDNPIILVGHSMGGTSAPLVAERLLEQGYNVSEIIMIAPPGLTDRTRTQMVKDFVKLGNKQRVHPDISALYPSPADVAEFRDRYKELKEKHDTKPLSGEEREELEYYKLALKRYGEPDKLLLSALDQKERDKIHSIDDEMQDKLDSHDLASQAKIAKLQKERVKILQKKAWEVVGGKIDREQTQKAGRGGKIVRNVMRSGVEIKKTIGDLAKQTTVDSVQDVIDYNNNIPDHSLDITLIGGSNDPIIGDYELGQVDRVKVGPNTTLSEINMHNFDHFTLPDDPVRVAQVIQRIIER